MLSRKYYREIAKIIYEQPFIENTHPDEMVIDKGILAEKLANYFKKDNFNFDKEKFLNYCYYGTEKL